jgi:hypothetical protein
MTKSSKSSKRDYSKIDIHDLLEQRHQVAVIWGTEDILEVRPDLTEDQAWQVLQRCYDKHDCELGFTWMFIEIVADEMFPHSDETTPGKKEAGHAN